MSQQAIYNLKKPNNNNKKETTQKTHKGKPKTGLGSLCDPGSEHSSFTLQIGQDIKPKVILGPSHLFSSTR